MVKQIIQREYIFDLPKKEDSRGNLSVVEEGDHIPFKISRVYWIYDVPAGQKRGSHAFKTQQEIVIALSGSFDVVLDDGSEVRSYHLDRAFKALYIPSKMWRTLQNFSTNSVCLVISSGVYDENEYIRNYRNFKKLVVSDSSVEDIRVANSNTIDRNKIPVYDANDCKLINLPIVKDRRGNITYVHNSVDIPFDIKRIFFIYDIPTGKSRGMHAHKCCEEFILSVSGSFSVELDDGKSKQSVLLNHPMQGVHVLPGIWKKQFNYSSGAICLVLASDFYHEDDYIRKYSDFKNEYGNRNKEI